MSVTSLAAPTLQIPSGSPIETFHDADLEKCGTTPVRQDGPLRVFEDQFNVIHMTMSNADAKGYQWTGSVTGFTNNPTTAELDCTPVMIGNVGNTDVSKFDQKTWIQGFYFDGTTAWAYGHQDFWGGPPRSTNPNCHASGVEDDKNGCWYASIATWKANPVSSADRHLNFTRNGTAPNHIAIYPHVQYPGDLQTPKSGWIGYGAPSNIFRGRNQDGTVDGYWYMFVYTNSGHGGQAKGQCLFRSSNPADRTSWRAWNGNTTTPGFTQVMGNPYTTTNSTCAVVQPTLFNTYVRSVVWHKPSRHYIAIYRVGADGVYWATSPDMLNWTQGGELLASDSDAASYPVLIDFDGGDWGDSNFDRAYDNGKLYLFYRKKIAGTNNIRITRRLVDVTNYPADPPSSSNPG
ncbi:hypothetical protein OK349_05660 [Sphingomonas sp. BT-65]|uniref:hypothetical protein n=1 Tax=Sphingomonas sp. BT-65 TaxID=2989821 RepID=UPI002235F527|nr:hypothetical protein [Sphingomonas sp. BT-65]MCW4461185.1 hypothetical protein [Sphingomonas sp. BT-65]